MKYSEHPSKRVDVVKFGEHRHGGHLLFRIDKVQLCSEMNRKKDSGENILSETTFTIGEIEF